MTIRVDQFHTNVAEGSSISNQILNLQDMLRGLGYQSEIFCEQLPVRFAGRVRPMAHYAQLASANDVLLLHFSLNYSHAVMDWLKQLPGRKVIIYHNITPATYFAGINGIYWEASQTGRQQLAELSTWVEAGWGVSAFNVQELATYGWAQLGVLPIIFNPERFKVRPDRKILKRWGGGLNVLFVGRISPNKRLEDVILTFYYLKRFVCPVPRPPSFPPTGGDEGGGGHLRHPEARLFFVGSAAGMERYFNFLQALIKRLDLSDVIFTGHITTSQWLAYYQSASIYLSMSEHEGFGIPLLESMHFGIPIIAYKAAAIPETLGGSGVLVNTKDHAAIAELIGLVLEDENLRTEIVARQRERLQDFLPANIEPQLRQLLQTLGL